MGYGSYYRELLEPLGLYAFAEGGLSAAEADALGEAMDALLENLDATEREATLATAEDAGLSSYEALLPFRPVSDTLASRRQALAALLRIDGCSFTLDALQATLSGCGIPATVSETGEHFVVEVRFPEHRGIPQGFEEIARRIGEILPCHLEVRYVYQFPTWGQVEAAYPLWGDFEDAEADRNTLERLEPEEGEL